ncbi:hypothetical protein TorRG33x02_272100 [Trema orientale]|uniref:Uncharacterized protein n=1 Tax=Trema orientale TaxID=63057 RepID=A0A2P5CVD4_TREOI|nr:hypothetical protein TorRG33x02_272100 [Trema orientale]
MICWRHLSASARSRHSEAKNGRRSLGFFFSSAFKAMKRLSIDCAFSSFLAILASFLPPSSKP